MSEANIIHAVLATVIALFIVELGRLAPKNGWRGLPWPQRLALIGAIWFVLTLVYFGGVNDAHHGAARPTEIFQSEEPWS